MRVDAEQSHPNASTIHSQRRVLIRQNYDLLILAVLALLIPGLPSLPVPFVRVLLGLALVLFGPGYALAAAIFPRRQDLDGVTRTTLSFGLSIAVIPVLALLLSITPWGIRPWPVTLALVLWTFLLCIAGLIRRSSAISSDLTDLHTAIDPFRWWHGCSRRHKYGLTILALALGGLLIGVAPLMTRPAPRLTEFYILGKNSLAEDYPRQAALGEAVSVTMGVVNRENIEQTYRVEVWVVDSLQPERRDLVGRYGPITLPYGEKAEQTITWKMPRAGEDEQVEILLFSRDNRQPYRILRLWLDVAQ